MTSALERSDQAMIRPRGRRPSRGSNMITQNTKHYYLLGTYTQTSAIPIRGERLTFSLKGLPRALEYLARRLNMVPLSSVAPLGPLYTCSPDYGPYYGMRTLHPDHFSHDPSASEAAEWPSAHAQSFIASKPTSMAEPPGISGSDILGNSCFWRTTRRATATRSSQERLHDDVDHQCHQSILYIHIYMWCPTS